MTGARHWWGRRWQAQLDDVDAGDRRAVAQGRALARRGAVTALAVAAGTISGEVAEDRTGPRTVSLAAPPGAAGAWVRAAEELAGQLRYTAALLEGGLPEGIDEVLDAAGVTLLPALDAIEVGCGCDHHGDWCRHAAALYVVAGLAFDRDPGLLLRFRGGDPVALVARVRDRGLAATGTGDGPDLTVAFDRPRGELDAVPLHPERVDDPSALLHHLGPPPGVEDTRPLTALVSRAAARAWRLAAGAGAEAADEELLLAELRAQRTATAASLAEALGREVDELRTELDRLFAEGTVLRTGSGARARYRAASS